MKIICTQENLKKAIFNCERVVAKKNTLPILNNILFETDNGGLRLSATNLEIGVSSKIGAKIEKEGKITIPAKVISNFINNLLSEDNISLEVVDNKLKIKSSKNKAIIMGIPADDFPLIPIKKNDHLLEISADKLKKALSSVLSAVALNESRQELTGINFIFNEEEISLAATDSFRLAEFKIKATEFTLNNEIYNNFIKENNNIIVPSNTIIELNRIISNDFNEKIKITIEESQIFFEIDGIKIVSRLIDGKYPDYKQIIPKEYKTKIIGDKSIIQNAIKLSSIFSSNNSSEITLKIDQENKKIFMLSANSETGENSTEVNFEITGVSQEIVFNSKYLLDGVNIISSSKIAILSNTELTPVAIKEVNEKTNEISEELIYIVMPVKN